ncbi:ArnT family glycosyltransferase [Desulfosediminicola sp.]|uniref:ArnT family glycosyltransferase n=1 Tax=Desulfosediminicola sp. TaxID=2886825 RepID=UPI003AF2C57A
MLTRASNLFVHRFPYVIATYFILQILVRLITTNGVTVDESEQVMLTQYFALGYNAQPPLYTWLQMIFFGIFGKNVFAIALLKNLTLFSIYIFTYATALLLTENRAKASLSAVGLLFLPQLVWEAQIDQIHTVLLTASTAAFFYFYFYAAKKQTLAGYLLFGVSGACGLLAKYNFVIVVLALLVATLMVPDYRRRIFNKKLCLSIAVAIILTLPHIVWFLTHMDLATSETITRMNVDQGGSYLADILHGSVELVLSYLAFIAVFLVFYLALFRKQFKLQPLTPAARLLAIYIATTFLAIFAIVLISQSTNIKERWLQPFLFILPLLAFMLTDLPQVRPRSIRIYTGTGSVLCLIVMLIIPLRVVLVDFDSKPHRENYPFKAISEKLNHQSPEGQRLLVLTEDKFIGGNLRLFMEDATLITPSIPLQKYTPEETVLVVWQRRNPIEFLSGSATPVDLEPDEIIVPYRFSKRFDAKFYAQVYSLDTSLIQ